MEQIMSKRSPFLLTAVLAAFLMQPQSAAAFDMEQTVEAAVPPAYPFRILDAYPGMTFAEMQAAMAVKELELSEARGTLTLRSTSGASISAEMPVSYATVGFETPMHHQGSTDAHYVLGDLTTPASGSVVATITRTMHFPPADATPFGALLAQLTDLYGAPSSADGSTAIWRLDPEGNKLGDVSCSSQVSHAFRYLQPDNRDMNSVCGAEYIMTHWTSQTGNGAVTKITFTLIDHALLRRDAIAASEQLDAGMTATHEASDMDL
jgi:hypothetical protein